MAATAWPTNTRTVSRHGMGLRGGRSEISPGIACPHVIQMPTGISGLPVDNPIWGRPHNFAYDSLPQTHNPNKNETALLHCAFRALAGHGGARMKKTRKPRFYGTRHVTNKIKPDGADRAKTKHSNCCVSILLNYSWRGPSKTADRQKRRMQSTTQIIAAGFRSCMRTGYGACATASSFKRPQSVKFSITTC